MVEKAHTAAAPGEEWWPSIYAPLRGMGQRIADFFAPDADAAATDKAYEVSVELPGVNADQIEVSIADNTLTIKGEKRSERKEEGKTYYFSERTYGTFHRSFRLPSDAVGDGIAADFKDGVLTLKVPKSGPPTQAVRKIPVQAV